MSTIRRDTANLSLGILAFFPGGLTEGLLHTKYGEYLDEIVSRLEGAAIEFELIGITLRNIANDYEEVDRLSGEKFRVTEEELERATEAHTPTPPDTRPPPGPGRPGPQP
jgi:hypothetical protein